MHLGCGLRVLVLIPLPRVTRLSRACGLAELQCPCLHGTPGVGDRGNNTVRLGKAPLFGASLPEGQCELLQGQTHPACCACRVSNDLGAGRPASARRAAWVAAAMSVCVMLVLAVPAVLFRRAPLPVLHPRLATCLLHSGAPAAAALCALCPACPEEGTLLGRRAWGSAFTDDPELLQLIAVSTLTLGPYIVFDGLQTVLAVRFTSRFPSLPFDQAAGSLSVSGA